MTDTWVRLWDVWSRSYGWTAGGSDRASYGSTSDESSYCSQSPGKVLDLYKAQGLGKIGAYPILPYDCCRNIHQQSINNQPIPKVFRLEWNDTMKSAGGVKESIRCQ
jgi:hypothetical protein